MNFTPAMNVIPLHERPRERCLESGPSTLSLRECLAVILGSGPPGQGSLGLASQILTRPGSLPICDEERAFFTAMESSGSSHLQGIDGLGPAGQARVMAAFELGRRYTRYRQSPVPERVSSYSTAAIDSLKRVSPTLRSEAREWLGFVALHRTGELGDLCIVEKGSRTHVNIDPAELFARLLTLRPKAFILFHNHPSGSVTPSFEDYHLTQSVRELAEPFGLKLLGHWIVSPQGEHWMKI
jgi:DNA repair protein RadC